MNSDSSKRHHRGNADLHAAERRRAYQLRREREIGNWGRASEHIGRRWEELGFERLQEMLERGHRWPAERDRPRALVPLMGDVTIQSALTRIGLPSPDVVIVLAKGNGDLALQALDFKWDLEFASYDQIRAGALAALLARDQGVLGAALARSAGHQLDGRSCVDGLLFAPDSPANRHFLASRANQRQEYPIEEREVIFASVAPEEFFSPLPAWQMAVRLAELDRSTHSLQSLDGAERYYRLGAGLLGAVGQLQSSIFDAGAPPVDAGSAIAWFSAQVRPLSCAGFVSHAERLMAVRGQQIEHLKRLTRSPYRFSDLARALARRGIILPEGETGGPPLPERERWRGVLRRVNAEYRELIIRAGQRLTSSGLGDAEALARLASDGRRYEGLARAIAERLIEDELEVG